MTDLEFFCFFALFILCGIGAVVCLCVMAKRSDERLQAYVQSRQPRVTEELESIWDLPSREPVR